MKDYKAMYYQLAAKVADAIQMLIDAQQQGERQFIEANDYSELILLKRQDANGPGADED